MAIMPRKSTSAARQSTLSPVMGGQNFPDPAVIRIGNSWYGYATNARGGINGKPVHIMMAKTDDWKNWTFLSAGGNQDALPVLPAWVDAADPRVWAPDVVQLSDGSFVMYFSAALASNPALHCIGTATSTSPTGP
ncbi:hypothetical protein LTR66_014624, partial [Elasticomyces elasticus]